MSANRIIRGGAVGSPVSDVEERGGVALTDWWGGDEVTFTPPDGDLGYDGIASHGSQRLGEVNRGGKWRGYSGYTTTPTTPTTASPSTAGGGGGPPVEGGGGRESPAAKQWLGGPPSSPAQQLFIEPMQDISGGHGHGRDAPSPLNRRTQRNGAPSQLDHGGGLLGGTDGHPFTVSDVGSNPSAAHTAVGANVNFSHSTAAARSRAPQQYPNPTHRDGWRDAIQKDPAGRNGLGAISPAHSHSASHAKSCGNLRSPGASRGAVEAGDWDSKAMLAVQNRTVGAGGALRRSPRHRPQSPMGAVGQPSSDESAPYSDGSVDAETTMPFQDEMRGRARGGPGHGATALSPAGRKETTAPAAAAGDGGEARRQGGASAPHHGGAPRGTAATSGPQSFPQLSATGDVAPPDPSAAAAGAAAAAELRHKAPRKKLDAAGPAVAESLPTIGAMGHPSDVDAQAHRIRAESLSPQRRRYKAVYSAVEGGYSGPSQESDLEASSEKLAHTVMESGTRKDPRKELAAIHHSIPRHTATHGGNPALPKAPLASAWGDPSPVSSPTCAQPGPPRAEAPSGANEAAEPSGATTAPLMNPTNPKRGPHASPLFLRSSVTYGQSHSLDEDRKLSLPSQFDFHDDGWDDESGSSGRGPPTVVNSPVRIFCSLDIDFRRPRDDVDGMVSSSEYPVVPEQADFASASTVEDSSKAAAAARGPQQLLPAAVSAPRGAAPTVGSLPKQPPPLPQTQPKSPSTKLNDPAAPPALAPTPAPAPASAPAPAPAPATSSARVARRQVPLPPPAQPEMPQVKATGAYSADYSGDGSSVSSSSAARSRCVSQGTTPTSTQAENAASASRSPMTRTGVSGYRGPLDAPPKPGDPGSLRWQSSVQGANRPESMYSVPGAHSPVLPFASIPFTGVAMGAPPYTYRAPSADTMGGGHRLPPPPMAAGHPAMRQFTYRSGREAPTSGPPLAPGVSARSAVQRDLVPPTVTSAGGAGPGGRAPLPQRRVVPSAAPSTAQATGVPNGAPIPRHPSSMAPSAAPDPIARNNSNYTNNLSAQRSYRRRSVSLQKSYSVMQGETGALASATSLRRTSGAVMAQQSGGRRASVDDAEKVAPGSYYQSNLPFNILHTLRRPPVSPRRATPAAGETKQPAAEIPPPPQAQPSCRRKSERPVGVAVPPATTATDYALGSNTAGDAERAAVMPEARMPLTSSSTTPSPRAVQKPQTPVSKQTHPPSVATASPARPHASQAGSASGNTPGHGPTRSQPAQASVAPVVASTQRTHRGDATAPPVAPAPGVTPASPSVPPSATSSAPAPKITSAPAAAPATATAHASAPATATTSVPVTTSAPAPAPLPVVSSSGSSTTPPPSVPLQPPVENGAKGGGLATSTTSAEPSEVILYTSTMSGSRGTTAETRHMETLLYIKQIEHVTLDVADNRMLQRKLRDHFMQWKVLSQGGAAHPQTVRHGAPLPYNASLGRQGGAMAAGGSSALASFFDEEGIPPLPLLFVGPWFIGTYKDVQALEDDDMFLTMLHEKGYVKSN